MFTRTRSRVIAAVFASLLILAFAAPIGGPSAAASTPLRTANGSMEATQGVCSNASLQGSYGFRVEGTNVSNSALPYGPFAALGKNTYDGQGGMQGEIVVSANGTIFSVLYKGAYTLNADCTGQKSVNLQGALTGLTVTFDFLVDSNLHEIRMIMTQAGPTGGALSNGLTVSGDARELFNNKE
jgi:hypothetical protein